MISISSDEEQEETDFNKEDYCQCLSPVTYGGRGSGLADVGRQPIHCGRCGKFILKRGPKFYSSGCK